MAEADLSPSEYLERHQIDMYLRDVVTLLLRTRDEQPLDFISEYFGEVLNGTHVLLREFAVVNRCPRDRWAFVQSAREALADLDQEQPSSAPAITQLLRLVCPDFPLDIAADAARLCGDETGTHPLGRLLHATCVRICFGSFLHRVNGVFSSCDMRKTGRVERAVAGLALRQAAIAHASNSESAPPAELFDDLTSGVGDISLTEVEQFIVHAPHLYTLLQMPAADLDGKGSAGTTLIASPPPRDAASSSPGSVCAAAVAAASKQAGRRSGRSTRDRLMDAAAAAAACAATGQAGSASSAPPRRTMSASRGGSAAAKRRLASAGAGLQPPPPPPPHTPR